MPWSTPRSQAARPADADMAGRTHLVEGTARPLSLSASHASAQGHADAEEGEEGRQERPGPSKAWITCTTSSSSCCWSLRQEPSW